MKFLLAFSAISAGLSVLLGALAAHALKEYFGPESLSYFGTAVEYQMIHSVAILAFATLYNKLKNVWLLWGARCFAAGIIFFSGSLYVLALTDITWIGPVTPLGGLFLVSGWVCLLVAAYEYDN
ncbi:DUF423 domain-containing protein [Aliiglaciecola sp. M165]|uniref:DUF423 domain-containing protein n=1 Tax=Aliiglaciecola sp. M165 TaxID=2593649 RepID=UPI00117DB8AF|nr:DUF423 domain-containing protein [Aliiglaciecola sp. M165]TRY29331.1 DUF423 domain-containing protein [Aliiglaciecola sp. M165]